MTKEVLVTISGTQVECVDVEENKSEAIEIISPATYFFKDGLHYIFYEEVYEGITGVTKNKIVYKENERLELIKKGVVTSEMVFDMSGQQVSEYRTPFIELEIGMDTNKIQSKQDEHELTIDVEYALAINGEVYAMCNIKVKVVEKSKGM